VVAVENGPGGEGKKGLLWIWRWGWWFRGLLVVGWLTLRVHFSRISQYDGMCDLQAEQPIVFTLKGRAEVKEAEREDVKNNACC
jgi:hypothetical protein